MPWQCEFPSKKETLSVLENAGTPMADYYRGCILYHFERYEEACAAFEACVKAIDFAPAHRCLALGLFDHLGRPEEARAHLERALELYPDSDRIFYELTQLYKSLNLSIEERAALYERYESLTARRDDCTLAYSVLKTVMGDYESAKKILLSHRFHTYEGGEGNLTCHHAWLHLLMGRELMAKGDFSAARDALTAGLTFPENYGEEKNYFVNDAHLYLSLAECEAALGNATEEQKYLALADGTKGAPTPHTYFQVAALRRAGKTERAQALAEELYSLGETKIKNAAVNDYYGVGAPAYPPFGYDIVKAHTTAGNTLCAFGALALGRDGEARSLAQAIKDADCADFHAYLFSKLLTD
jgi:tetratricopeptide (TPR) repeat protein